MKRKRTEILPRGYSHLIIFRMELIRILQKKIQPGFRDRCSSLEVARYLSSTFSGFRLYGGAWGMDLDIVLGMKARFKVSLKEHNQKIKGGCYGRRI